MAGLKIWGSPVQPEFNNWAFNVARGAAIRRYWEMIPESTDVLVSHGPPFGMLDKSHPSTAHLGCEELAKAVEQIKPETPRLWPYPWWPWAIDRQTECAL